MILVEIQSEGSLIFQDRADNIFADRSGLVFADRIGTAAKLLSLEGQALERYWDGLIDSFGAPNYQIAKRWGGFIEMQFGSMSISPDVLSDNWPPPKQLSLVIKYTETTEAAATILFQGTIYLTAYDIDSITYQINSPSYTADLLDTATNVDGDTVPVPRAFGAVTHKVPLQLEDYNSGGTLYPHFHLSGVGTGSTSFVIESFTKSSTKTLVTTTTNHTFSNGNSVIINGNVDFNGTYTVESATADTFIIDLAFPTTLQGRLPLSAHVFISGNWIVYDAGQPIMGNVVDIGDGTFYLTKTNVGQITISGTASQTDLEDVATWCKTRMGVGAIDVTNQRATSPSISCWISDQQKTVDFLSEICAFFTHYVYIESDIMYLGDMLLDNGTTTLDESEYFDVTYGATPPVNAIRSEWVNVEVYEGYKDGAEGIDSEFNTREIPQKVIETQYERSSGTTDGAATRFLIDSGADFTGDGVKVGDTAKNTTDDTSATVIDINGQSLELDADIFASGEEYSVGPTYSYGTSEDITPFHDTKANVKAALQDILSIITKDTAEITMPISGSLPKPGGKVTISDDRMVVDTSATFWVREMSYDYENYTVRLSGEGEIS